MTIDDIRKILSLQAIEQADESQQILSDSDYREAATDAGAPLPKSVNTSEENQFLGRRADMLLIRATSRFPDALLWANQSPSRQKLGVFALGLFIFAAVIGFLTNELGPEKKINILSFPLLGIMLWSLLIYVREITLLFKKRGSLREGGKTDGLIDLLQPAVETTQSADAPEQKSFEGARIIFGKRWRKLNAPVIGAKLKSLFHTTALILAAAAIAGMYVKGLANEYRAVWESTFFEDSEQLRPFLNLILGPASAITGNSIPSVEALDRIHWKAGVEEMAGENAARWIHWYAITVSIFVIIPRGLLALLWRFKATRLEEGIPFRTISPDYYEHLLAVSTGSSFSISLVPYPVSPEDISRRRILRSLEDQFEKPVEVTWMAAVPFGEEEDEVPGLEGEVIPLFDFSSTPEKETHLALYQTLSDQTSNPIRFILLDTAGFERKMSRMSDAEERREDRTSAWKNLFETVNTELILINTAETHASPSTA